VGFIGKAPLARYVSGTHLSWGLGRRVRLLRRVSVDLP
jgi:hypothetical protein